jgi:hypothetical protein
VISGADKIAKATAEFMDTLDELYPDARIDEVLIAVELTVVEDEEEWSRVQVKGTPESAVHRIGLVTAAADILVRGGDD